MTGLNRIGSLLVAALALAACSVNELGNIPCTDNTNCPADYPTCSSRGFCVMSASAAKLQVSTGDQQSEVSGKSLTQPLAVIVLDTDGNPVEGFTVSWAASAGASVSAATTTTGPNGKAQVTATLGNSNGSYTFTASAAGLTGSPVTFTATGVSGPAAKLVSSAGADQTAVAGSLLSTPLTVKVTDANDNPVQGATVTWATTAGGGNVAQSSSQTAADGTASVVAVLGTTAGANTYTASASLNGTALAGSPMTFHATGIAGAASKFVLSGPTSATAGVAQVYTLTAQDTNNNTAISYRGTATITTSDTAGVVPASHTFTSGDAGVFQFQATLKTAGTKNITAVDSLLTATIPGGIAVAPAAVASFTVTGFPTTIAADTTGTFTVTAFDAFSNVATNFLGAVTFGTSNGNPALPADYTFQASDAGIHTFSAQLKQSCTSCDLVVYSLADSAINGAQSGITVTGGAATVMTLTGFPNPIDAGTSGSLLVTLTDQFNNIASPYRGTVHITTDNPGSTMPANYTFTATDAGSHTFTGVSLKTASTGATPTLYSITAADTSNGTLTATIGSILVNPAPASSLQVTGFPTTIVANTTSTVTVTARDSSNNVAVGYRGTVHFTSDNSNVNTALPATYTFTATDQGVHTFSNVKLGAASPPTYSITATDNGNATITGSETGITVNPGPAVSLKVTGFPSPTTAGVSQSFTVTAVDASGNTATGYTGTVHFTSTDGSATLPANSTLTSGTKTFTGTLKTSGSQTITATDTATSSITGTSSSITVNPAAAASFTVTAASPETAGVAFNLAITAKDSFGNIATGYAGTVHFTSTDPQAILPADTTLSSGQATLSATLKTAGARTITATDTVTSSITGVTSSITVNPASAGSFTVTSTPTTVTAGVALTSVVVTAKDAFGNTATGYSGTVHLTSTDAIAVLPADSTLTSGTKTYSGTVTLKTSGPQTITATDTVSSSITGVSPSITVNPAATSSLAVVAASPQTAGTAFSVSVTAKDQFNNTVPTYAGTVHFTSNDGAAILPANSTLTSGTGTFNVTLKTAGAHTVVATDTVTGTITGTANITVNPASASTLIVSSGTTQTAGVQFAVTVTAKDPYGNTATGYTGPVHFTSTDVAAVLPSDSSLSSGAATFNATLKTTPSQTITVTDTVTSSITGNTGTITVNPGAANSFVVTTTAATNQVAGGSFSVTVTAKDSFSNTATNYTGTIHFTSTDGQAVLPANSTLTAGTGTKNFTGVQLKTAGANTITATDTVNSALGGVSPSINVVATTTSTFLVAPQGSTQTAGNAFNLAVTAKDQFGNTTASYTGTVHFTSSDGSAVLPADTTLSSGTSTLLATFRTAGSQTITATDTANGSIAGTSNPPTTVNAANASTFVVSATSPQTAGTPFSVTVTAKDPFGNTATGYTGTVHFTTTDANSPVLPTNSTLTSGTKIFTNGVTLKTATTQTITVTDTVSSGVTGTSGSITVNPAGVASFTVTTSAGSPQTAGVAFDVTVTAKDQFSNVATGYTGTVHFTKTDSGSSSAVPADSTLTSGVRTFTGGATLVTAGPQTISVNDKTTTSIVGSSPSITVGPASAETLAVTGTATQTAGSAFTVTVTAKDHFGNTATGYAGTVHFTTSDANSPTVPPDSTLTSGTKVFTNGVTLKTSASQTVTATDTVTSSITGTLNVTVSAATAATLVLNPASTTLNAGTPVNVTVTAKDAFNNTATGYAGTVHFTSTDGTASLPANGTLTSGVGTFSVTLNGAGTQTVTATDTVTATITGVTPSITVNIGPTAAFSVSPATTTPTSGSAFNVTVTAKDAGGNTTTGYTGTVAITSTDGQAVLPANATLTSGTGNFSVTLKTAGSQTVTATDTANAAITGTSSTITVQAGAMTKLVIGTYPASSPGVVAGFANSIKISAQDANNNNVPSYVGTVHFTSNDGAAALPADYTFTGTDAGSHTFSLTLNTVVSASASITAADGTFTISQTGITVAASPLVFGAASAVISGGSRSGQIFITGGYTAETLGPPATGGSIRTNTYFYDPASNVIVPGPSLNTARYSHTATAIGTSGVVVIAGGPNPSGSDTEFEVCTTDGASPACTPQGSQVARCNAAAAAASSTQVIIAGGDNCTNTTGVKTWDMLNTSTNGVSSNTGGNDLGVARRIFTATAVTSGVVLFAGGNGSSATADKFTLSGTTMTAITANASRSGGHSATLMKTGTTACPTGPCVLLAGGNSGTGLTWEIYDQSTGTFPRHASSGKDMAVAQRVRHVAASFANGRILLAGGTNGTSDLQSMEYFDPSAQTFTLSASQLGQKRNEAVSGYFPGAGLISEMLVVIGGNTAAPAIDLEASP